MTATYELGDVVAERRLEAIGADGRRTTVVLRIGRPMRDPQPGGDWYCPRQVLGLGDESVEVSHGVDSLQAFLLCVNGARLTLPERASAASVRLDWLGHSDLGLKVDPELLKELEVLKQSPA